MKIKTFLGTLLLSIGGGLASAYASPGDLSHSNSQRLGAKNRYLVEWSPHASRSLLKAQGITAHHVGVFSESSKHLGVSFVEIDSSGLITQYSDSPPVIVKVEEDPAFCRQLMDTDLALSCTPDYQVRVSKVPNEPDVSSQYWHSAIESPAAWDVTTGDRRSVIAVLDTGVDYRHPDLAHNMWRNPGEVPNNGLDDDNNGVIDDVHGYNAEKNTGDPLDDGDHGTHVAGIIGAEGNNGIGVAGVTWNTQIMGLKFITAAGWGMTSDAIKAMDYLVMMKKRGTPIRAINNSWGGPSYSKSLENAIRRVTDEGIIFLAAAGNSASDNDVLPQYPASYDLPLVVSVAASDQKNNLTSFSCYGQGSVDIAAPGSFIKSTITEGRYEHMSGTSMATPVVTGALALLFAQMPQATPSQAIDLLYASGKPMSQLEGFVTSGRLLNVNNLIRGIGVAPPTHDTSCTYSVSQIPYAPPQVDSTLVPAVPDRVGGYPEPRDIALPFAFPFYDVSTRGLMLGASGFVQLKREQFNPWDEYLRPFAPPYSIAALHIPSFEFPMPVSIGAFLRATATRVDILWKARHAWNTEAGTATTHLSLFPSGTIEVHLSLPNDRLARTTQLGSLIGIRGGSVENALTLSSNGFPVVLRGNMGFRFERGANCATNTDVPAPEVTPTPNPQPTPISTPRVPDGSDPTPAPEPSPAPGPEEGGESLQSIRVEGSNKRLGLVQRGRAFSIRLSGIPEAGILLTPSIDGTECANARELQLSAHGTLELRGRFPSIAKRHSLFGVQAAGLKATARITSAKVRGARTTPVHRACRLVHRAITRMKR
jgi:subtilisin family serine protease